MLKNLIAAFALNQIYQIAKENMSPFWHVAIFSSYSNGFSSQRVVQKFVLLKQQQQQQTTNGIYVNDDLPYIGIKCTWYSYRISDFECNRENRKMTNRVMEQDNRWHILRNFFFFSAVLLNLMRVPYELNEAIH